MNRLTYWVLSPLLLGLAFLGPVDANPVAPPRTVQDDAGFFSTEAKTKANEVIADIKRVYHKDLMIDVLAHLELPAGLDRNDHKAFDRFMDSWASQRFKNYNVDGILVVIVKDLKDFRIEVGQETLKKNFTREDMAALKKIISSHLKKNEHDKALLSTVDFVLAAEKKHSPHAAAAASGGKGANNASHPPQAHEPREINWALWIAIGIGALILLWLIMGVARAAAGPRGGYGPGGPGGYGGGYGGGGGGGGFFPSLLGGLFGAAAGMWMYSHFFGGQSYSSPSSPINQPGGMDTSNPSDVGAGDPVGTGGSWGDTPDNETGKDDAGGGGDDWRGGDDAGGGGDTGAGGDWGGGGGGGDYGGGGGGDWGGGGGGGDWGGGGGGDWGGGGGGGDW